MRSLNIKEHLKRSWTLTKSSWRVLKLDKELVLLPAFNFLATVALVGVAALALIKLGWVEVHTSSAEFGVENTIGYWITPLVVIGYIATAFVANFFSAAIIHGALERFGGGDPTIRSSITAAGRRWRPILFFSIMIGIVGLIFDYIQDRVSRIPYLGGIIAQLLVSLAGFAWAVANFFSLAHIMHDEEELTPIQATKKSVGTIKRVWGESVVSNAGLGLAMGIITVLSVLSGAITAGLVYSVNHGVGIGIGVATGIGLLALLLVSEALSAILKAAIFHYAISGEAPELFDRKLIRTSMTPKKARGIFGGTPKGGTWAS